MTTTTIFAWCTEWVVNEFLCLIHWRFFQWVVDILHKMLDIFMFAAASFWVKERKGMEWIKDGGRRKDNRCFYSSDDDIRGWTKFDDDDDDGMDICTYSCIYLAT